MMKFRGQGKDGAPVYGLGLSEANMRRLKSGMPIRINTEDLGGPPGSIMVFYGRTEEEMAEMVAPWVTMTGEKPT